MIEYDTNNMKRLNHIEVTKGKMIFYNNDGSSHYIEDESIIANACFNGEDHVICDVKSVFGKKSILKKHFKNVQCYKDVTLPGTSYVGDLYDAGVILEFIHDGITSFIAVDECVNHITLQNQDVIKNLKSEQAMNKLVNEYCNNQDLFKKVDFVRFARSGSITHLNMQIKAYVF